VCLNQELPDFVLERMIRDNNYISKVKGKVAQNILDEMTTREKQKTLAKHIIWTEPVSEAYLQFSD
jgi:hypothetical protein